MQLPDGGWGETIDSCRQRVYSSTPDGQVVMTAWALLGLAQSELANSDAVRAGTRFLRRRQQSDGGWPEETIAGVFNRTCAINYDNYRQIFGLWALAAAQSPSDTGTAETAGYKGETLIGELQS
jgi:lanosterol synthase